MNATTFCRWVNLRAVPLMTAGLLLSCLLVARPSNAQEAVRLADNNPTGASGGAASDERSGSSGDDFDSLLRMAEQDVSQLTQVQVSQRVPSLDTVVTTVSRTASTVG